MGIERFEEILSWKKGKELSLQVYEVFRFSKDYSFRDQIQRASISICNNIAEGFERGGKQEFIQFLYVARGSCGELRSQLGICKDVNYLSESEYNQINALAIEVSKQLNGFIQYLKGSNIAGQKFHGANKN